MTIEEQKVNCKNAWKSTFRWVWASPQALD